MDPAERGRKKREIDEHIAIGRSRLTDNEIEFLYQFIVQYDRFSDLQDLVTTTHRGFSSDGRYTRRTETRFNFDLNAVAIHVDWAYRDDDGQEGEGGNDVEMSAREVINWFRENHRLRLLDGVRDIVALIV